MGKAAVDIVQFCLDQVFGGRSKCAAIRIRNARNGFLVDNVKSQIPYRKFLWSTSITRLNLTAFSSLLI